MTLHAFDLTVNRRSNEAVTVTVPIYSSEPGVVTASASGCTFPDGETVTIPGTRTWRNGLKQGQYLARANCLQARLGVSFVFEVDWDKIQYGDVTIYSSSTTLVANWNADGTNRANWIFCANVYAVSGGTNGLRISYYQSITGAANMTGLNPVTHNEGARVGKRRYVFLLPSVETDNNLYTYYINPATPFSTGPRNLLTAGTVGGNEICAMQTAGVRWGKYARLLDETDRALWLTSNTFPATAEAIFNCNHELNESNPIFYDESGNNLDFGLVNVPQWPEAAASGDFTDDPLNPVVPASSIRVTIPAAVSSPVTLSLSRPRAGVPSRATDEERFETATGTITLATTAETVSIGPDVDCQVPSYPATIDLIAASNYDGNATVVSDDPAITPTSPVTISNGVATCPCTVTGDVTGATLTVTGPGGDTDTASVTVAEVPEPAETLEIGPDVTVAAATYPCVVDLMITSNTDGVVNLASDDANLEVDATATVSGGVVEIEALALADVTGAIITASRPSGVSDTCTVTTVEDLPEEWIAVGPNQRTRLANARVLWPIRVRSSVDGAFAVTAEPADGLTISGPFVITGGSCDFTAQPTKAGTWTLTVTQDGRTDSVTLEALAPVAAPVVRQYNMAAVIDAFFEYVNRRYGLRPRFTPTSVQDARAEHSTDRSYSRYAQGSPAPGPVFSAVSLSYQITIAYSSTAMAEQDLGMIREEAERYDWDVIGFQFSGQTMFEPVKMNPRLTITMNFDIIPQGR